MSGPPRRSNPPQGRARILGRIRDALSERPKTEHPGRFEGLRPAPTQSPGLEYLEHMFHSAGGTCVRLPDLQAAAAWLQAACEEGDSITVGVGVPDEVVPPRTRAPSDQASVGISLARAAVAETGTLVLESRDGRRSQLLAPRHFVLVHAEALHETLVEALAALRVDLPSALGLHSGPSKSADIGQVMVRGVHGPGAVVALVIGGGPATERQR